MSVMAKSDPTPPEEQPSLTDTAEVAAVVKGVQRAHRGRIRWGIGKHTAELALRALEPASKMKARSSKSRRRKRHKRLL